MHAPFLRNLELNELIGKKNLWGDLRLRPTALMSIEAVG